MAALSPIHPLPQHKRPDQAVAADQAVHAIGMPEAGVVIAQCVTWLDGRLT